MRNIRKSLFIKNDKSKFLTTIFCTSMPADTSGSKHVVFYKHEYFFYGNSSHCIMLVITSTKHFGMTYIKIMFIKISLTAISL